MTTPIRPEPPKEPIGPIGRAMFPSATVPRETVPLPMQGPTKALAAAELEARNRQPDRAAKIAELSRQTGMTSAFIAEHFDALTKEAARPEFDAETFARESPLVASWLAEDPNRVALLAPDLTRMSGVERQLRAVAQGWRVGNEQVELSRIGAAVLNGTVTPAMRERQRRIEAGQRLTQDYDTGGLLSGALPAAAQQVPIYLQSFKAAGAGAVAGGAIGGLIAATPAIATGQVEAVAPAFTAGARLGAKVGAGGALYLQAAEMEAALAILDYERMVDANGVTLDAETARGAALVTGALNGALESVADIVGAKLLPGARNIIGEALNNPTTRSLFMGYLRDVARSAATEGATETMQSVITQVSGRVAAAAQDGTLSAETLTQMLVDPALWQQAIAEGKAGAQAAVVLGGAAGGVRTGMDIRRARTAEAAAKTLDQVAAAINDGATAANAPAEVESMVTTLQQAGVEGGYVTAADWKELWQSVVAEDGTTADPREAVLQVVGDATEYDHAAETDGAFHIPLDKLLTRLMRTPELRSWATEHVRFGDADAMSAKEAKAFREAMAVEPEAAPATEPGALDIGALSDGLESHIRAQLTAVGRPAREADAAATVWAGMFRSLATRSASDPQAVADLFMRVVLGGPNGPAVVEAMETQRLTTDITAAIDAEDAAMVGAAAQAAEDAAMLAAEREGMQADDKVGADAVRTSSGRLVNNLSRVSTPALVAELARLYDTMAMDQAGMVALENEYGDVWTGTKNFKAAGRNTSRSKTVEKVEAELARRGVDSSAALADYANQPKVDTSFNFGANVQELWQAAFHGTPHFFDKFTTAKMGTGEGAQAYGYGLYFAESEDVAGEYARRLGGNAFRYDGVPVTTENTPFRIAIELVDSYSGEKEGALYDADSYDNATAIKREIRRLDPSKIEKGGALYRVDIADEAVATFLDWDKPLSEQAPEVLEALTPLIADIAAMPDRNGPVNRARDAVAKGTATGEEFYRRLSYLHSKNGAFPEIRVPDDEAASKALLAAGIRGIKFLDAGSRLNGGTVLSVAQEFGGWVARVRTVSGFEVASDALATQAEAQAWADAQVAAPTTRNLVVFDENDITITHRNGEPVTAAERATVLEQRPLPDDEMQGIMAFWSKRTFDSVEDGRATIRRRIESDNQRFAGWSPPTDPNIADAIPFKAKGKKFVVAYKPPRKEGDAVENPLGDDSPDGRAPDVRWDVRDNADDGTERGILEEYGKSGDRIYRAYVSLRDIPVAKGEDITDGRLDDDSGARADLSVGTRPPPPVKLRVTKSGKVQILDGNHRIAWWREQGYESVPAYVLDARKEPRAALEQSGGAEPQGRITMTPDLTQVRIDLLGKADASTFMHEAAHFYLAAMRQLATADAPAAFRADLDALYAWLGATPGEALTVAQEEQFARGFEEYLRTQQAPSLEMRGAFQRFRAWLTRIYRKWKALVALTPEVVAIMDRMVATDAEIAAAEAALAPATIFRDDPAIQTAHENAVLAAREALDAETLAVVFREEEAWYKAERKALAARIATALNDDPAYRARALLVSGTLPDGTVPEGGNPVPMKLDKAAIVALVGEEAAKAFQPFYRLKDGAHPDEAAGALGFESGAALLSALAGTVNVKTHINALADAQMRETHGDPLTDGTVATKAQVAIHNTARADLLRLEMAKMEELHPAQVKAAFRKFGGRAPSTAALREQARTMLKGRALRSLRNGVEFHRAEVKAAREAIAAATKGDWEAAATAKLREALSAALYREAQAILAEVDKAKAKFERAFQSDEKLAKTRDMNYVNTARAVLARVGYGLAAKSPAEYLAATQSYTAPEEFARLRDVLDGMPLQQSDFRDLTVAEVEVVAEVFGILWETSLDSRTIEKDGVRVQRKTAIAQMDAATVDLTSPIEGAGLTRPWESTDTIKAGVLSARAWLARVEHLVDYLDSLDPAKPWRKTIYERAREGTTAAIKAQRRYFEQVDAILTQMGPLPTARIAAPELGAGWQWKSHAHLLGAMLHVGNQSSKDKLLGGYGWSLAQWNAMVQRFERDGILTAAHYQALQAIGDLFEEMKPAAQEAHKAQYGYYFQEITFAPVVTRFGTFRGWYAPASRDPDVATDAKQREAERQFEEAHGFTFPQVAHGFTKERTASVAPLLLDLRLVKRHISAVQRFVHLGPVVKDLAALFRDRDFLAVADRIDPRMVPDLLAPWLKRVSTMVVETPTDAGRFGQAVDFAARHLRLTASMAFMTVNVKNAIENYLSLAGVVKLRVPQRHLTAALGNFTRHPRAMAAAIAEKSDFMAERMSAGVIEVARRIDAMLVQPNTMQSGVLWLREHSQFLQRITQHHVETVTWWAAYEHALAETVRTDASPEEAARIEREAVRAADATVRLTLGSFEAVDVSAAEVGTPLWRVVAMFAGWFNMVLNLNAGEAAKAVRATGLKKALPKLGYIYTLGIFTMVMSSAVLTRLFRGQAPVPDDEDDDGYLDDWMGWYAGEHFRFGTAMLPAAGQLVQLPVNKFDDRVYNDRLTISPAISFLESAVGSAPKGAYDVVTGDFTKADVKSLADFLALMTGTPSLSRPAGYLTDVQSGAARPTGPLDVTRGLITGRP